MNIVDKTFYSLMAKIHYASARNKSSFMQSYFYLLKEFDISLGFHFTWKDYKVVSDEIDLKINKRISLGKFDLDDVAINNDIEETIDILNGLNLYRPKELSKDKYFELLSSLMHLNKNENINSESFLSHNDEKYIEYCKNILKEYVYPHTK
ncbi:hypothetical protein ACWN8V_08595 [Vagococcus elongatus]|uniref:Uncharacterized protein n=1 Tax=Vagococcus elongatus TaxID=180344 RepID=A0A430ATD0_9ENTE|nr:hypothetical protein [Vagococcus elongatus]RSU11324.1 hypothetical protein CBF29_08445 [Vagococcus elongatus]